MKRASFAVTTLAALFLAGCGGNNGGGAAGGGGGLPTAGPLTFVEAVLAPGGVAPSDPAAFVVVDPLNVQVGQIIKYQLATYSTTGVRTVLPVTEWRNSDETSAFGQIGTDSGLYEAGNVVTTTTEFIGTRYNGVDYFAAYQIKPAQASVQGQVVDSSTGQPIRGAAIEFYDASGVLIGTVRQPFQGNFRASLPLNAATFTINSDTLPTNYRRVFSFEGNGFRTGDPGCYASSPTFSLGNNSFGTVFVPKTSEPEPDLTGCG